MQALLDLEILGIEERVKHLNNLFEARKSWVNELSSLQKQFAPYAEDVRISSDEWERLQRLVDEFQQTTQSNTTELTIVQPAALAFDGVRSNRTRIFASVFVLAFAVATVPRLANEWRKAAISTE
jgi:hypothetical protein